MGRVCLENDLACTADEVVNVLMQLHALIMQALPKLQEEPHDIWTMHNASFAKAHFHQLLFLWHLLLQCPATALLHRPPAPFTHTPRT